MLPFHQAGASAGLGPLFSGVPPLLPAAGEAFLCGRSWAWVDVPPAWAMEDRRAGLCTGRREGSLMLVGLLEPISGPLSTPGFLFQPTGLFAA